VDIVAFRAKEGHVVQAHASVLSACLSDGVTVWTAC
jgi:hypothetical protein